MQFADALLYYPAWGLSDCGQPPDHSKACGCYHTTELEVAS